MSLSQLLREKTQNPQGFRQSLHDLVRAEMEKIKEEIFRELRNMLLERAGDVVKGDRGYTPVKGVDYFTAEEIKKIKEELKPIKGKDYLDGRPGKDASPARVAEIVLKSIKLPKPKEVNVEEIVDRIIKDKKLKPQHIDGLEQTISAIRNASMRLGGGGDRVRAGTNVTITDEADGTRKINASGAAFAIEEPTGAVDDSNLEFVFTEEPKAIVVNGNTYRKNKGWTWNAGTLTATLSSPVGGGGDIYGIM